MRGPLPCCVPYMDPAWPSGTHLTHARTCRMSAGQKVREFDYTVVEDATRERHPAGKGFPTVAGHTAARRWRTHRNGCHCASCRYTSFWLDRDDDLGVNW